MSDAEIGRQHVELLPARTVLSMHRTGILGGDNGTAGTQGGAGKSPSLNLFEVLTHAGTANSDTAAAGAGAAGSADKPS